MKEIKFYVRVGKTVWEGIRDDEGRWHRPDFTLIRTCKDPEEAEEMVKELNRYGG